MRVAAELKANPARSDREIVGAAGVSHTSVQRERKRKRQDADDGAVAHCATESTGIETDVSSKRERVMAELRSDPSRRRRIDRAHQQRICPQLFCGR